MTGIPCRPRPARGARDARSREGLPRPARGAAQATLPRRARGGSAPSPAPQAAARFRSVGCNLSHGRHGRSGSGRMPHMCSANVHGPGHGSRDRRCIRRFCATRDEFASTIACDSTERKPQARSVSLLNARPRRCIKLAGSCPREGLGGIMRMQRIGCRLATFNKPQRCDAEGNIGVESLRAVTNEQCGRRGC
jgi:hypothetical protein